MKTFKAFLLSTTLLFAASQAYSGWPIKSNIGEGHYYKITNISTNQTPDNRWADTGHYYIDEGITYGQTIRIEGSYSGVKDTIKSQYIDVRTPPGDVWTIIGYGISTPFQTDYTPNLIGQYLVGPRVNTNYNLYATPTLFNVVKATPNGTFTDKTRTPPTKNVGSYTLTTNDLNATFKNQYNASVTQPSSAITYQIIDGGSGTIKIGNTLKAGKTYKIRATFVGDYYYNTAYADASFTINTATQTITATQTRTIKHGETITLDAKTGSEVGVTYTITSGGGTLINGNQFKCSTVGTTTITATSNADSRFETATINITVTTTNTPPTQTVTLSPTNPIYGDIITATTTGEDVNSNIKEHTILVNFIGWRKIPGITYNAWKDSNYPNDETAIWESKNYTNAIINPTTNKSVRTITYRPNHIGAATLMAQTFDQYTNARIDHVYTIAKATPIINPSSTNTRGGEGEGFYTIKNNDLNHTVTHTKTLPTGFINPDASKLTYTYGTTNEPLTVGTQLPAGATYNINITYPEDTYYKKATKTITFTVNKSKQTVTFKQPKNTAVGTTATTLTATATSGLPITYTITSGSSFGTISGNTFTPAAYGTVVIRATQAGDAQWNPAYTEITLKVLGKPASSFILQNTVNGETKTITSTGYSHLPYGSTQSIISTAACETGYLSQNNIYFRTRLNTSEPIPTWNWKLPFADIKLPSGEHSVQAIPDYPTRTTHTRTYSFIHDLGIYEFITYARVSDQTPTAATNYLTGATQATSSKGFYIDPSEPTAGTFENRNPKGVMDTTYMNLSADHLNAQFENAYGSDPNIIQPDSTKITYTAKALSKESINKPSGAIAAPTIGIEFPIAIGGQLTSGYTYEVKATYPGDSRYKSSTKTATFKINQKWSLTPTAGTGGTVTPNTTTELTDGVKHPITATPNTGYRFNKWVGSGITNPNSATTTILMDRKQTPKAQFIKIYTLTIQKESIKGGNGTINILGTKTYDTGTVVTLVATPNANSLFSGWIGPVDDPTNPTTTITMNDDYTITALFTKTDQIVVDPNTIDFGKVYWDENDPQNFTRTTAAYSKATITNTGNTDLQIRAFAVQEGDNDFTSNPILALPRTIAPNASIQLLRVDFNPASKGEKTGQFTLTSTDIKKETMLFNAKGIGRDANEAPEVTIKQIDATGSIPPNITLYDGDQITVTITATDIDNNLNTFTYSIEDPSGKIILKDTKTATAPFTELSVTTNIPLDNPGIYKIYASAKDSGNPNLTGQCTQYPYNVETISKTTPDTFKATTLPEENMEIWLNESEPTIKEIIKLKEDYKKRQKDLNKSPATKI